MSDSTEGSRPLTGTELERLRAEYVPLPDHVVARLIADLDRNRQALEYYVARADGLEEANERLAAQVESMRAVVEAVGQAGIIAILDAYDAYEQERSQPERAEPTEYPKEEHDGE